MDFFLVRSSLVAGGHLSLEGRQIIRAIGNKVRLEEEPTIDCFFTSPLAPAVQTAELFADRVDYVGVVEVMTALSNNVPPEVIAPMLLARGATSMVIVADEPALSALGAFLVGRPTFPPLLHGQVSVIRDRQPAWCMRPGEIGKSLLLVA